MAQHGLWEVLDLEAARLPEIEQLAASVAACLIAAYAAGPQGEDSGTTTVIAAAVCFLLGVLAGRGEPALAGALAIGVTALLYFKPEIEGFSAGLKRHEQVSVLQFLIVTFIVLPILPDRGYGVAKVLAIVLVSWSAWLLASLRLLPFTRSSILLMVLLMAAASAVVAWRRRAALLADLRQRWEMLLFVEAVFAADAQLPRHEAGGFVPDADLVARLDRAVAPLAPRRPATTEPLTRC